MLEDHFGDDPLMKRSAVNDIEVVRLYIEVDPNI